MITQSPRHPHQTSPQSAVQRPLFHRAHPISLSRPRTQPRPLSHHQQTSRPKKATYPFPARTVTSASAPPGYKGTSSHHSHPTTPIQKPFKLIRTDTRNHQNRQHNLGCGCELCKARFGLHRHENTVHRPAHQSEESSSIKCFKCPNMGCKTQEKEYPRKDNYLRHVKRCENAIAKAQKEGNAI